jgi:hypothetical protein
MGVDELHWGTGLLAIHVEVMLFCANARQPLYNKLSRVNKVTTYSTVSDSSNDCRCRWASAASSSAETP